MAGFMAGVQRSGIDRCVMRVLKGQEMAQNMSLADQVIQALADVRQMDDGIYTDCPERNAIWNLKRLAEQAIADAMRAATELAWQAKAIRKMAREIEESAKTHNALAQGPGGSSPGPAGATGSAAADHEAP